MQIEGSKILVTGGTGLIGSHIIDRLIAEHPDEIIAFDKDISGFMQNCSPELDYKAVTLRKGDITRRDEVKKAIKGVDFVFHTAALLTKEAGEDLRAAYEVNVGGTFNLIEESVAAGVKKIIYSSTTSIYGDPVVEPMTEDHPVNPDSIYGASKAASELLLSVFKKKSGLDYIALRYPPVYGPRQSGRTNIAQYLADSFDRIDRNLPPLVYGDGSQQYDYVYVDDVARANIVALKSPVSGESFLIGTGVATSVADIVSIIREITGTTLEAEHVPQGSRFRLGNLFLDVTKAEKMMGYKTAVPLKNGLEAFYRWRKENALF